MNFILVTGNKDKLDEARKILQIPIESVDLELDELQELDPIKIANHKAKQAWNKLQKPLVVWDQSLYIDCLNGFPGPLIKWFWQQVTLGKICEIVKIFNNQKVYNETILTYFDGESLEHFRGRYDGIIPDKPRGENGWGWDAIFIPEGQSKTYAEMLPEEVINFRGHRIALEKLKDWLNLK